MQAQIKAVKIYKGKKKQWMKAETADSKIRPTKDYR